MNVLIDPLPDEWNGYRVNMEFQVGIQIMQAMYDTSLTRSERSMVLADLLFGGLPEQRLPETAEDFKGLLTWYMSGWNQDHAPADKQKQRLLDYDIDQWRIYADFRNVYGINLNEADLHWWEFQGMLWNMPFEQSSFLQVIEIRQKKIEPHMSAKERTAIMNAKKVYGLEKGPDVKKEYTEKEAAAIDAYDKQMEAMRSRKDIVEQIKKEFEDG